MNYFSSVQVALKEFQKGKGLILLDDPERENQADLIFPAEYATAEKINFMLQECRGMICVPVTKTKTKQLDLPLMIPPAENTEKTGVNFTVTIDSKSVKSFGISAGDRALTIRAIADPKTNKKDFVRPGHVFPLLAAGGGVSERGGHTEATIELLSLAGLNPAGVLCEILNEKGEVASLSELIKFSGKFNIKIITIPDIIKYVKK